MNKRLFFFCIGFCAPLALGAQTVKMINSSVQQWSGGIAGRSGANYVFVVEFSNYQETPVPDTLWIDREPFPVNFGDFNQDGMNTKCTMTRKTARFEISVGTFHDEYADRYAPPQPENKIKSSSHPPIDYKGIGLLSYKYLGKEHFYTISKIMNIREPANYP
jgi:hypothetical protein